MPARCMRAVTRDVAFSGPMSYCSFPVSDAFYKCKTGL